jgi:intracellular multiplication protein IcmK
MDRTGFTMIERVIALSVGSLLSLLIGFPATAEAQSQTQPTVNPIDNQAIGNTLAQATQPAPTAQQATHNAAFDSALNGTLPLSPSDIRTLLERLNESQAAAAQPTGIVPRAEVKAETISLDPGAEPPEIDTESGYVTTVSFLDATGSPWPILDVGVGGNFDVPAPEQGGNVLRISPLSRYASGNLSVRLVNLTTPLSFRLRSGTDKVYYRYDARVPKFGPQASSPLIDHGINTLEAGDAMLMNVLDGAPPTDSTRLAVTGTDQRSAAWRIGGKVYLRTPLSLLSPAWEGSVSSGDGTHVFVIPDTPVLLLSDNGVLVHARLSNRVKPDGEPLPAIEDGEAHPLRPAAASQRDITAPLITPVNAGASAQGTGSDQTIASPNPSRTLIRPVAVQNAAPPQQGLAPQAAASPNGNATGTLSQGASP